MVGRGHNLSRRGFFLAGIACARLTAQTKKSFPSEIKRYEDRTTELESFRLTDPEHNSVLPSSYNRAIAHNSGWMLFCSDREGTLRAHRIDLKSGETREICEIDDIDPTSLTLTPDNRSFCFFARKQLYISLLSGKPRQLYQVPDDWERCPGMCVGPDGTHVTFAERQGDQSRLRMVPIFQGATRTVIEAPFVISHPLPRPMRAQILFRQQNTALWLVNMDGTQKRQLKLASGGVGPANWSSDGRSILYLNFPEDTTQLTTIRESLPDTNAESLVAKTSQYADFGFNQPGTVFVGACRSAASPTILIMLRSTKRELTLCEHKASHPDATAPRFAPDTQRLYYQSDREGKSAIYCMHVERFLEKTDADTGAVG